MGVRDDTVLWEVEEPPVWCCGVKYAGRKRVVGLLDCSDFGESD